MSTFTVRMRCVVEKVVTCEADTEAEVRAEPWEYATDEYETDQMEWQIISVKEEP